MPEIPQFPVDMGRLADNGVPVMRDYAHVDPNALAAPGRAVERGAQGTEEFAQHLGQLAETSALNYYNDNLADAETGAHQRLQSGIDEAQKSGNYQGFAASQVAGLQSDINQRLAGAPLMVRDRLKARFAELQDQIASRASRFEHGMAQDDAQAKTVADIDTSAKLAYRDPTLAAGAWSRINDRLNTPGEFALPAPRREALTKAAGNAIFGAALLGRAESDPEGALKDLNAGKYDPYLDAPTIEGLRPQLQSALAKGFVNRLTASGAIDEAAGAGAAPAAAGVPPPPPVPDEYQPLIAQAASASNVPPELLSRLLSAESSFNPAARSPKGAMGIGQFMPQTAADRGLANPDDPAQAIAAAAQYLAELHQQRGSWTAALAGYLGGDPRHDPSYLKAGATQLAEQLDSGTAAAAGQGGGQGANQTGAAGSGLAKLYHQVDGLGLDPALALQVKAAARTQYDATLADQARAVRLRQRQQRQASDQRENQIIADARSDHPTITVRQAADDPALTPAARLRMVQFLGQNGEADPGVSHQTAVTLMKGIAGGQITSQAPIIDAFGQGRLNWPDFDHVNKQLADAGADPGFAKRKAMFLKAIEPQIDKSGLTGLPDPAGKERFYEFAMALDRKAAAMRAAGKDPDDLLDPAKPDYLGKPDAVQPYQSPLAKKLQDALGASAASGAPAPPDLAKATSLADLQAAVKANPQLRAQAVAIATQRGWIQPEVAAPVR